MIATRPIHGKIGAMSYTLKEGKPISEQMQKLVKIDELKKSGAVVATLDGYKKLKADEAAKDKEAVKKGEDSRKKLIDSRKKKAPKPTPEADEKKQEKTDN